MTTLYTGKCAICGDPAALDAPEPHGTCGACRVADRVPIGGCAVFLFFVALSVALGVTL